MAEGERPRLLSSSSDFGSLVWVSDPESYRMQQAIMGCRLQAAGYVKSHRLYIIYNYIINIHIIII